VRRLLEDLYLAVGVPRPLRELLVSTAARERGVATPEVAALAIYPAGPFYRADLATRYIPGSADLAQVLFGAQGFGANERIGALSAAGRLVRTAHEHGVVHVDLNLQNVLLEWTTGPPVARLLDLDRCRVLSRAVPSGQRMAMLRRFDRSIRKWERRTGRLLQPAESEAFAYAYGRDPG